MTGYKKNLPGTILKLPAITLTFNSMLYSVLKGNILGYCSIIFSMCC